MKNVAFWLHQPPCARQAHFNINYGGPLLECGVILLRARWIQPALDSLSFGDTQGNVVDVLGRSW